MDRNRAEREREGDRRKLEEGSTSAKKIARRRRGDLGIVGGLRGVVGSMRVVVDGIYR